MRIHLIAIGGAVMHNIALELHNLGHTVSGSDDEIFDPALQRLKHTGICPDSFGWFPEKITPDIDAVILGMHARANNPELIKANQLGLKVYSFPEYVYQHAQNKKRIVVGGSHGKTTTTAMIMHVLKTIGIDFDYLVGSLLDGFDRMVRFSNAPIMVIEGDEYLTSPLDPRPKFHHYKPHIAMLTGIAWDHINVFPTFEGYVNQFRIFVDTMPEGGNLVFYQNDPHLQTIAQNATHLKTNAYNALPYTTTNGITTVTYNGIDYPMQVFGKHNLENMNGAMLACQTLGISPHDFLTAMQQFKGTAKRLELLLKTDTMFAFRDFAHSPSKLKATIEAVKEQFPDKHLIAIYELHTFSSLNQNFLAEYADSMLPANTALVYVDKHVFELKQMQELDPTTIQQAFRNPVKACNTKEQLIEFIKQTPKHNAVYLLMSSGNFSGINWNQLLLPK